MVFRHELKHALVEGAYVAEYLSKEAKQHKDAWWPTFAAYREKGEWVHWRGGELWKRVEGRWKHISVGSPPDMDEVCTPKHQSHDMSPAEATTPIKSHLDAPLFGSGFQRTPEQFDEWLKHHRPFPSKEKL